MNFLKNTVLTVTVIVLALISAVVLSLFSFHMYEYFAPKYTAVDAAVFKESVQYNDGMIRDLENLKMQYDQADHDGKAALRPIILHRFAVYDENRLPTDLRMFYDNLRAGSNQP